MKFQQSIRGSSKIFALFIRPEKKLCSSRSSLSTPWRLLMFSVLSFVFAHGSHCRFLPSRRLAASFLFSFTRFRYKISSRDGNDTSERRENSEREKIFLMKKIIVATAEESKYFVRDIYFISGIIYDFQMRDNFSFRRSHSTRRLGDSNYSQYQ